MKGDVLTTLSGPTPCEAWLQRLDCCKKASAYAAIRCCNFVLVLVVKRGVIMLSSRLGGGAGGRDLILLTLFGQEDGRKWDVGRLRCCFVSLGGYAVMQAGRHKSVSFFKVDFPHPCLVEYVCIWQTSCEQKNAMEKMKSCRK